MRRRRSYVWYCAMCAYIALMAVVRGLWGLGLVSVAGVGPLWFDHRARARLLRRFRTSGDMAPQRGTLVEAAGRWRGRVAIEDDDLVWRADGDSGRIERWCRAGTTAAPTRGQLTLTDATGSLGIVSPAGEVIMAWAGLDPPGTGPSTPSDH